MKLNLECNKVGDAGVKLLSEGLRHPNCVLQTLLLDTNELSPACCGDFSSILSTSQTLTELALEYNGLEDAGVRLLCEGLKQPSCKLQKLRLARCNITAASCEDLSSALAVRQTLTELVVECNELRDPGVKLLCRGLKHPHCKLQLLNLYNCDLTAACCADLASALSSNQTLTELFLGGNQLGDSGVQLLCEGLKHPKCMLQKLCLCSTEITAAGWGEICSALSTNQMLEDIDLWNNPLGDSGMRLLCEALKHPGCKLQILSLWNCEFTSASCRDLCSALSTNQSLKKLKLGGNKLGDSGVKMLCEGLKDPSSGLEAIDFKRCNLRAASFDILTSVLTMNQHIREFNLQQSDLGEVGVIKLCQALKHPNCKLQTLRLRCCNLSPKSCEKLASIVPKNQNLRMLYLDFNNIGDAGLIELCQMLMHPDCQLQVLR
uniref:Uncharacterized protein n=1 Tax=Podarcis muralis TaxID=64176 RepID=A0A670HRI0_PODMU